MIESRPRLILGATTLVVLVLLLWSCVAGGDNDGESADQATTSTNEEAGGPNGNGGLLPDAPPITPVTGGTSEDGQPEPPPIHAVFSVVVRGETSWYPYAGPELNGLDEAAARAIAGRLRQIDSVLQAGPATSTDTEGPGIEGPDGDTADGAGNGDTEGTDDGDTDGSTDATNGGQGGISASIELAYGPAAALCETDPELLDQLEAAGHRIGMHASSTGEAFRASRALEACGRVATTASGLAAMADPHGPEEPTLETLVEALGVLSVLDLHQVVGRLSSLCTGLGLAEATHGYGTGAFTAPWRSGWTIDEPCNDLRRGRIVMIDQNALAPAEGESRIDAGAWSTLRARTEQTLAYALDLRFAEPGDLPPPGIITWGVTVRLDDLIAPDPPPESDGDDDPGTSADDDDDTDGNGETAAPIDVRTAPLSEESLAELVAMIAETWGPSMESGRLKWLLPDEIGLMMRPLTSGPSD